MSLWKIHRRRRNCTKAVPLLCVFQVKFPTLSCDAIPNAAMATFSSPPTHAGNLYASPFYGQDEIIIPHHGGGCKREFEIIKRRPAIGRVSFLFDKLDFLKPLGSSDFLCLDEAEIVAFEVANAGFINEYAQCCICSHVAQS